MTVTLGELALDFGCELNGDPDLAVTHVATLSGAGPGAVSFLANPQYEKYLAATKASVVILAPAMQAGCQTNSLAHPDPYRIYAQVAARLHPQPSARPGVHSSAVIDAGAEIDATAQIDAGVVIGANSKIAAGCVVGSGTVIEQDVTVAADCRIGPRVVISQDCSLGKRCVIHPGAVIGCAGFGYAPSASGWLAVPQLGRVVIGDDVDIGANATIDRGAIDDTVIEDGVKIDNLVQIAHNVRIGAHTAMAAQVGIAGSTTIGRNCMFAGHAGTVGHISICDGVVVSGKTMVTRDITEPGQYGAALPAMPMTVYRRVVARIRQLDKLVTRVKNLENRNK